MTLPPAFFENFRDSMPSAYRQQQSADEIRAHAQIVWRRGNEPAHAEIWTKRINAVVVCIVTDDRPGLSSLIRATIAAHGIDVLAAQAYCRKNEKGRAEAVHFFWLSPTRDGTEGGVGEGDISNISASLSALLRGETDLGAVFERASTAPPSRPAPVVDVGFAEDVDAEGAVLLTVDVADRPGLLGTITSVLYAKEVSVLASDLTTSGCIARARLHVVEADGAPLSQARAREVASAVLDSLQPGEYEMGKAP
jgi:UTP:GlnB (protein PII) uridylyltransferase